jgi:hypothetical protein
MGAHPFIQGKPGYWTSGLTEYPAGFHLTLEDLTTAKSDTKSLSMQCSQTALAGRPALLSLSPGGYRFVAQLPDSSSDGNR